MIHTFSSRGFNEGGYTLVELLLVCVIATGVIGTSLTLLESSANIQARDSEAALVMQENRAALSRIIHDVRQATKVEEATGSSIYFLATLSGVARKIKYECNVAEAGTSYTKCVRFSAEAGKTLPTTGTVIARYITSGSEAFSYSPNATSPTAVTVQLSMPAQGNLKQAGSVGYKRKVVLEDTAFMRNLYLKG